MISRRLRVGPGQSLVGAVVMIVLPFLFIV